MAIPEGHKAVTAIVSNEIHDHLHQQAGKHGVSVSQMLAQWIESGVSEPLNREGKTQRIRAQKDELFVSLPRAFIRSSRAMKKMPVRVAYSTHTITIRVE